MKEAKGALAMEHIYLIYSVPVMITGCRNAWPPKHRNIIYGQNAAREVNDCS